MSRIRFFFCTMLTGLILAACSGQFASTPTINISDPTKPVYRIGIDPSLPPFVSNSSSNKNPAGFDIDLFKAIAKKAGINYEFVTIGTGYENMIAEVQDCQLDGAISAIPVSPKLADTLSFSEPYYQTNQVIVVRKGNLEISDQASLSGMQVGTLADSPSQASLADVKGVLINPYENLNYAYQDLIRANLDAVVSDSPRALLYTSSIPNNLIILPTSYSRVDFAIAFCKNNSDLVKQVNAGLVELKNNVEYNKLIANWLTNLGK
jgi:glutamine transport system substrate-binding protein